MGVLRCAQNIHDSKYQAKPDKWEFLIKDIKNVHE